MDPSDITKIIRSRGAKTVSDACYSAMAGQRAGLLAVGLGAVKSSSELHLITTMCFELMPDDDRAADLMQASIGLAKI